MKITERIALQQFEFLEIEGETLTEVRAKAEEARKVYADRLHTAPESPTTSGNSPKVHLDEQQPPATWTQFSAPICEVCGEIMEKKTGVSQKNGKPWAGWFCPKSTKEDNHPPRWMRSYGK